MRNNLYIIAFILFVATSFSVAHASDASVSSSGKIVFTNARYSGTEPYVLTTTSGLFTVNEQGKQVRFAKGNLQYNANSGLWKLAEQQWQYIGNAAGNNVGVYNSVDTVLRVAQNAWIDLFPWGSSGWDSNPRDKTNDYRPWARWYNGASASKFWIGGSSTQGFEQGSGYEDADWAFHNKIFNGGNTPGIWRTLSREEWNFVVRHRNGNQWRRLILKGTITGTAQGNVNGLILLPDNWQWKSVQLKGGSYAESTAVMAATENRAETTFKVELYGTWGTDNLFTEAQWSDWEARGAVFLPMAGFYQTRTNSIEGVNSQIAYWSSSPSLNNSDLAYRLGIGIEGVYLSECGLDNRLDGLAVRPVFDVIEAVPQEVDSDTLEAYRETAECGSLDAGHTAGDAVITFDRYRLDINSKAKFTVDGRQLIIAPSNLQYNARKDLWRLAPNPWDALTNSAAGGNTTTTGRDTQDKWIDLFSWGTSGWSGGVTNYQPWAVDKDNSKYYIGGVAANNMTGDYQHADWAWHNHIMNAGNADSLWRVMTEKEFYGLLRGNRGTKDWWYFMCCGTVHGVQGVIFFPDDWRWDSMNSDKGGYKNGVYYRLRGDCKYATENLITDEAWAFFESEGAVFFPLTGQRSGTSINALNYASYWTSTQNGNNQAKRFEFQNKGADVVSSLPGSVGQGNRYEGCAVRPVIDYGELSKLKLDSIVEYDWTVDDETQGTVTVSHERGSFSYSLTANPAEGFICTGWYDANDVQKTSSRTLNITINKAVSRISYRAHFEPVACTKPNVTSSNTDMGTVSYSLIDACNCEYELTATRKEGYQFSHWEEAFSGINVGNKRVKDIITPHGRVAYYKAIFTAPDHDYSFSDNISSSMGDKRIRVDQSADDGYIRIYAEADDDEVMAFWTLPCGAHTFGNPLVISAPDLKAAIAADTAKFIASYIRSDSRVMAWDDKVVTFTTTATDLSSNVATVFIDGRKADDCVVTGTNGVWQVTLTGDKTFSREYAGKKLHIIYKKGGDIISAFETTIPSIVKADEELNASSLNLDENSLVAVLPGAKLTFDEDVEIRQLDVYGKGEVVIPEGTTVHTYGVVLRADGTTGSSYTEGDYPQMRVQGALDNYNDDTIYYDFTINNKKYYPLILPYPVTCATGIRYADGSPITGRFEIRSYNSATRAATGAGWTLFDDTSVGATLQPYAGYNIYALPKRWNGQKNKLQPAAYVRFAMHADLTAGEPLKATPVNLYDNDGAAEEGNRHWNLIGNPYFYSYAATDGKMVQLSKVQSDVAGGYEYSGLGDGEEIRYVSLPKRGFTGYVQLEVSDVDMNLRPFNVFFVQAKSAYDLSLQLTDRPAEPTPAPAMRRVLGNNTVVDMPKEIKTGITLTQGEQYDKTGILFGDAFTTEYDYNADLVKLLGSDPELQLYSLAANNKLAFCALPYSSMDTLVLNLPIGYVNLTTGSPAVIAFDARRYGTAYIEHIYLTDNAMHTTSDLLTDAYTFTPETTTDDTRFMLTVVAREYTQDGNNGNNSDNVLTGIDDATKAPTHTVAIYDMLGREYPSDAKLPQGVYIIVENNNVRKEFLK